LTELLCVCALQSLEILDLSYNQLTGELPDAFAAMGSLRELLLDVNRFTGPLPDVWARLPNLQKIFLSENQLTGPLPEAWADLTKLTDLWLEYNQVRGGGFVGLGVHTMWGWGLWPDAGLGLGPLSGRQQLCREPKVQAENMLSSMCLSKEFSEPI
jgi:hypothetical protein